SLRYTAEKQPWFDKFVLDTWYNYTVANGDTQKGAKQNFLNSLLVGPNGFNIMTVDSAGNVMTAPPGTIRDFSMTDFAESTLGYRAAASWGGNGGPELTLGSDFIYLAQSLHEFVRLQSNSPDVEQVLGPGGPNYFQNLGIPNSRYFATGVFAELMLPIGDRLT